MHAIPRGYHFPASKIARVTGHHTVSPVVLVGCGSYSPITLLHLRLFETARDYLHRQTDFQVVGGFLSPVHDAYRKKGLAPATDRINMCEKATTSSSWITVDPYESLLSGYTDSATILDHFHHQVNINLNGNWFGKDEAKTRGAKILLLGGSDLIQTMTVPGIWTAEEIETILGKHGCVIIRRNESQVETTRLLEHPALAPYKENIYVCDPLIENNVSSTKVRDFIKEGMSIKYLVPDSVIDYIETNNLYKTEYNAEGGFIFAVD